MATLIDLDGYAHFSLTSAQAGSGFTGVYQNVGTTADCSVDTTQKRTPGNVGSLKVNAQGTTATYARRVIAAGNRILVESFYFRMTAAPAATRTIHHVTGPTNAARIQMDSTGHLIAGWSGGTTVTTSGTYADGLWHRIDQRLDSGTSTTFTVDWAVDGVAQTQAFRGTQTQADMTASANGSNINGDIFTAWYSDWVLSATTGDYPIGDHVVYAMYPVAMGTSTLGSTNPIVSDAGTNTNLHERIDDLAAIAAADTSTYVTYTSGTTGDAASNFLEVKFGGVAIPTIWDAVITWLGFASGTLADNATMKVLTANGGTQLYTSGAIDHSGSTTVLGSQIGFLTRPSGGWDASKMLAAVAQWGFSSDTADNPRLSAVAIEYAGPSNTVRELALSGVGG
jgi:hypothetical protein